jgi:Tol biopolymer transport system component
MIDERERYERAFQQFQMPEPAWDRLIRRRDRKRRNKRIAAAVVGISVALLTLASLVRTFRTVERPANEPTPAPSPSGIFADVGGWIAFQNDYLKRPYGHYSIWAVDPTRPNGPNVRIQLSDRPGKPLAWSSDGSKLLIWREPGALFVLNADGTETQLVTNRSVNVGVIGPIVRYIQPGGSFSPDGSEVAFAAGGSIYAVDADGGTPRLLRRSIGNAVVNPMFSPDGTKIAYFEFRGLPSHTLRVMNADGSGDRVLLGGQAVDCFYPSTFLRPAWSPDGTHIAFSCDDYGIRVVGADGSGLRTVIPNEDALGPLWTSGFGPYWSPDGSRIAFEVVWTRDVPLTHRGPATIPRLAIANADGTQVQVFQYPAVAGPWNPLPLSESGDREPATAEDGSGAAPLVYAIVLLGVVGVFVLAWRARRRTEAS